MEDLEELDKSQYDGQGLLLERLTVKTKKLGAP